MLGPRTPLDVLARMHWDLVVVGGGITGAGVLLEAARRGKQALLLEQRDFAWGTSSRSSKMVHGGLRYIAQGHLRLTRDALRERERLLRELPELVVRQRYAFLVRQGQFPGRWPMKLVLWLYDTLAGIRDHRWLGRDALLQRIPGLAPQGLAGAMLYTDALTDDARLVLRVLHEAAAEGARMSNGVAVSGVQREGLDLLVTARDEVSGQAATLRAGAVVNATGAWAGALAGPAQAIRPLRGSHLLLRRERLPVDDCVALPHPRDRRPVFIFPWLGMTCVGTTDLDHAQPLGEEPRCSPEEVGYLLEMLASQFPTHHLGAADVVSTMAGVRPVIASGKGLRPSQESREHAVWTHDGVVSVAGGKLTSFRLIALDALRAAGLIEAGERAAARRVTAPAFGRGFQGPPGLGHPTAALPEGPALLDALDWALANEMVLHLDDLLLRRVRVGCTQPHGARALLPQVRALCQARLGWDDARWASEQSRYLDIVARAYSLPAAGAEAA